jgi:outer membrane protein TolC
MIGVRILLTHASLVALAAATTARAQQPAAATGAPHDTVRLGSLLEQATSADPRQRQFQLSASAASLRVQNIDAERLPSLNASGQAQYQSAVTKVSVPIPGITIPNPPHDTYDARLNAQQSLIDPSIAPRRAAERAQLAETQAGLRVTLFGLRQEVNDAFFTALLLQERESQITVAIADLDSRLRETATRLREGTALPGDTAAIAATILQRRQDLAQARAERGAALARLSELVRRPIADSTALALPDLANAVAQARTRTPGDTRTRPEFAQFDATRARLATQEAVQSAQDRPKVSAFGRAGYGRPGLNALSADFQSYWLAGVQLQWAPWTWGTTRRTREALELQREITTTNEQAFANGIDRGVQQSLATMTRLDTAVALDERIVVLRAEVERETAVKLREGVVTASEYVDRSTDLLSARLAGAQHRVELAQARAGYLTMLGLEIP